MKRRDFLKMTGALAVAGAQMGRAACAPGKMRLGFQVYGIRDLCAKDFAGTLKAAKALGYEGVETGRFYGRNATDLGALVRDCGLELIALQLYPHTLVEPKLAETIRFCHACGCTRINTAWFKGSDENINDWQLVVDVLNHAAPICAKEGITIGYHNHDQEFRIRFDGQPVCSWIFDHLVPEVKQEFDLGWCVIGGGDPLAWLAAHPHRNPTVHVMPAIADATTGVGADYPLKAGQCGVGSARDKADWSRILPALRADGTDWLVVKPTAHPGSLADLAASRQALARMM